MTAAHDDARRIIMVLGPGRSGTSTVAGCLAMTGLEVPGLAIKGKSTNPSGFYEPRWVVDFHKGLLDAADVRSIEPSPRALDRINKVTAAADVRARLRDWLGERLETQPRLVVKDPRAVWFHELWASTCAELGVEPGYVMMLRHPTEVAGSREKHFQKSELKDSRRRQLLSVAGWLNIALITELATQGLPRSFVRYGDLVADWRKVLSGLAETHGLQLEPALDVSPHPVDEFIDPNLHRVTADWKTVDVPYWLSDQAERSWVALTALADRGDTYGSRARVADARREYLELIEAASALTSDESRRRDQVTLKRERRQVRKASATQPNPA